MYWSFRICYHHEEIIYSSLLLQLDVNAWLSQNFKQQEESKKRRDIVGISCFLSHVSVHEGGIGQRKGHSTYVKENEEQLEGLYPNIWL